MADPLSLTLPDPDHSVDEQRYILMGETLTGRLVVVVHVDREDTVRIISARQATKQNGRHMSISDDGNSQMREEYDFTHGVRGKYAERFAEASNVVVLDPDVASEFKSAREVNEALREVLRGRRASGDG